MVFSSLPLYHFDPPDWNQPNQQPPCTESPLLSSPLSGMTIPNQPAQNQTSGGVSRPGGLMGRRSRPAKIPQPEPALKCPRCDSTNTKFCYFNNHSLSQPRHLCKHCRRYWTHGGALRDVPVGGGSRRSKLRSSCNRFGGGAGGIASSSAAATSGNTVLPYNFDLQYQLPFLSFLADQYSLGLNFSSLQQQLLDAGDYGNSTMNGLDPWTIQQTQQFPFLEGLDSSSYATQTLTTPGLTTQLAPVMMEDSQLQAAVTIPGNDPYLGGGWLGDLSGLDLWSGGIL